MIIFLAWATLILNAGAILLEPAMFGAPREPWGYKVWFIHIVEALITGALALRVLGFI